MTTTRTLKVLAVLIGGMLYWQFVCRQTSVGEPWDSDIYWRLWYPLSFVIAAGAGYFLGSYGWLAGIVLTFAQLPVMWINNGTGPLIAVGVLFLTILAVPPGVASLLTGRLAERKRIA
ncbi:hypothetical protein [Sphingomonas sp.]|uniref:hypothetical protein n=1 Tax=Sphingomonas sp. TaxID=28214 RepID=UPI0035C83979